MSWLIFGVVSNPYAEISNDTKIEKPVKYNICPENSSTKGYCTEKLFEALQAGCIPIYSGHGIPTVLNKNKIIFYREDAPEEEFLQNFQSVYKFDGNVLSAVGPESHPNDFLSRRSSSAFLPRKQAKKEEKEEK